jgi:hypothetical protein
VEAMMLYPHGCYNQMVEMFLLPLQQHEYPHADCLLAKYFRSCNFHCIKSRLLTMELL